jgi:hypothetical protein
MSKDAFFNRNSHKQNAATSLFCTINQFLGGTAITIDVKLEEQYLVWRSSCADFFQRA